MKEKTFHIQTFGCQMNVRDSAWLSAALENRGFCTEERNEADIFILNTCSVREKPERKVADAIRRFQHECRNDQSRMVVVLGCVAQQRAKLLFEISPLVRLVAGTDNVASIPAEIERLLDNPGQKSCLIRFLDRYPEREEAPEKNVRGSAFVNIMQGCDNFCSYCIVPFTRGRQKSRLIDDILRECRQHLAEGASELILLGQNVNAYGKEGGQIGFAGLLRRIAELDGLKRLRFITPHPADMDMETIRLFTEMPALCPRLHLPLQSGSDAILAKMRRRYDSRRFLELARELRMARPDLALSTDLIVGFPGESEADFAATLKMMRECAFMSSFSFCYSDRPGTRASRMTDKIEPQIMQERLRILQELQDELSAKWLQARIGQKAEILLEAPAPRNNSGTVWQGKDEYGISVSIDNPSGKAGLYCMGQVMDAKKHSLKAQMI